MTGKRGPKPLPANVHLLRNNPSKKSFADLLGELQPEVELPGFPSWLWPEAKKEWKRVGEELVHYGLVSKLDRAALVLYTMAWAKLVWAEQGLTRDIKKAAEERADCEKRGVDYTGGDGIMVKTAGGNLVYSHFYVMQKSASQQVKWYLDLFGLSPASRSRVTTSDNRQQQLGFEAQADDGPQGGFASI